MKNKEDRRVKITKQALKEVLLELMPEYPIAKISVKKLCEAADINRSTFYAHYTDQYDLLNKIQQEAIAGIRQYIIHKPFIAEHNTLAIPVLVQVLEYAKENQTLFKVLLNNNNVPALQDELMSLADEKTLEETNESNRLCAVDAKYIGIFEIAGFISIMKEWLNNGCQESPMKLAELATTLLFKGVDGFYH